MSRPAACHPERPHIAHGLCRICYQQRWRSPRKAARRLAWKRPCEVCDRPFIPTRSYAKFCSSPCRNFHFQMRQARRDGWAIDSYMTTHDEAMAVRLVKTLKERGMRRISPRRPRTAEALKGPYFSAWKRSHAGGVLFVVRWFSIEEQEEELAA